MTPQQFWHEEPTLLETYMRAYYVKLYEEAHIYGYYNFVAQSTALYNALREKGKPAREYPPKPTVEDIFKKRVTKENLNQLYKESLAEQMDWVNSIALNNEVLTENA